MEKNSTIIFVILITVFFVVGLMNHCTQDKNDNQMKEEFNQLESKAQESEIEEKMRKLLEEIEKKDYEIKMLQQLSKYDPFSPNYNLIIASHFTDPIKALEKATKILTDKGYEVEVNSVFHTVTTLPKDIGFQVWDRTSEKWMISYQVGIQIINFREDQNYWKLTHRIVGSRSGQNDRLFDPSDFKILDEIFLKLNKKLMDLFSRIKFSR